MTVIHFFLTILVSALGGTLFRKLKIPAGQIIGGMFAVIVMNVVFDCAVVPSVVRPYIRILAGLYIGTRMSTSDILNLRKIIPATFVLVFGLTVLNFAVGIGISRITSLDLTTALLSSAPGGIQEMTLVADDLGANAGQVAMLQMIRVIFVIAFMPALLRKVCGRFSAASDASAEISAGSSADCPSSILSPAAKAPPTAAEYLALVCLGVLGGLTLYYLKVPSGAMIGAMIGAMALTFLGHQTPLPPKVRLVTQTLSGAIIGSGMGMKEVLGLRAIAVPAVLLVLALAAINLILGFGISRLTKLDLTTSLFAAAPGGVSDMSIIAAELGADSAKVATMQTMRLIVVVSFFPSLIKWLTSFLV